MVVRDFADGPVVKKPPANARDAGLTPVREDLTCHGAAKPMYHNN